MKLLAIDCTDLACSVALAWNGEIIESHIEEPRQHSRRLLAMIDELLANAGAAPADLDAFAWGAGPGSFTGLRIAASVVQGLAFAVDRPVVSVSSLHALAASALDASSPDSMSVCAALDARMGEVYLAGFEWQPDVGLRRTGEDQLIAVDAFQALVLTQSPDLVAGSAASLVDLPAGVRALPDQQVHARRIVELALPLWVAGDVVTAESVVPVYLRKQSAWKTLDGQGG